MPNNKNRKKNRKTNPLDPQLTAIGLANTEQVSRYGSASAEFIKGYTGVDNEAGRILNRGLKAIGEYKVDQTNPSNAANSIKQQAGFSAEVAKVSRENSRHIINKSNVRVNRTEDTPGYGSNHTVADHVETVNGIVDPNSHSQMKFVNDPNNLLKKIARGKGGGKSDLSRYLKNDYLEVPAEQVAPLQEECRRQSEQLLIQAKRADIEGKHDVADALRKDSENYKELEGKIKDSGLTRKQAEQYRLNPKFETVKDIAGVAHEAGIQGAQVGAAVGGGIALVMNIYAVLVEEKEFEKAAIDVVSVTGVSAVAGYATAGVGATIKAVMQQSSSRSLRAISKSSLPALALATCVMMGKSVYSYLNKDISETQLVEQISLGLMGISNSAMFSAIGQAVIPIPAVGALVGGMVGYTLSGLLYRSAINAFEAADTADARYEAIKEECRVLRELTSAYKAHIRETISQRIADMEIHVKELFVSIDASWECMDVDEFAESVNGFCLEIGAVLEFKSRAEFDGFMLDNDSILKI